MKGYTMWKGAVCKGGGASWRGVLAVSAKRHYVSGEVGLG